MPFLVLSSNPGSWRHRPQGRSSSGETQLDPCSFFLIVNALIVSHLENYFLLFKWSDIIIRKCSGVSKVNLGGKTAHGRWNITTQWVMGFNQSFNPGDRFKGLWVFLVLHVACIHTFFDQTLSLLLQLSCFYWSFHLDKDRYFMYYECIWGISCISCTWLHSLWYSFSCYCPLVRSKTCTDRIGPIPHLSSLCLILAVSNNVIVSFRCLLYLLPHGVYLEIWNWSAKSGAVKCGSAAEKLRLLHSTRRGRQRW